MSYIYLLVQISCHLNSSQWPLLPRVNYYNKNKKNYLTRKANGINTKIYTQYLYNLISNFQSSCETVITNILFVFFVSVLNS